MTLRPSEQPSHLDQTTEDAFNSPACPLPHAPTQPYAPPHVRSHAVPASQGLWPDFFERVLRR